MELSTLLRQASHDLHGVAETTGLMADLLHGKLSLRDYTIWLQNLQAIYTALEHGLAQLPHRSEFDFKLLFRSSAIAQDLACLAPAPDLVLCEATQRYVARLEALSASGSLRLLSHAYVRYLGDLHGGQLLRRCVVRLVGTDGVQALHFYDFGTPEHVAELIRSFRAGLNRLSLDAAQSAALAQEARLGFAMHIDMFQQLPHASGV